MQLRDTNISKLSETTYDALIIGGGINGAVSAAALSGKGVKTALIDQGDFAGLTSQESSNLAWGGIKYMETFEYGLVRKLCNSRNHLIRNYPSTVKEIRFFTTVPRGFRFPPLFIWLGAWLYWLMGNCFTKRPRYLTRKTIRSEEPAVNIENAAGGVEYSDAYLHDNDARFVFGFIRSALTAGCIAANYVEAVQSERTRDGTWVTKARNRLTGDEFEIRSKSLINAAGPLADDYNRTVRQETQHRLLLSKGIHLIVKRITKKPRVLTFFSSDGRLFFIIPMGVRTCIGTTDTRVDHPTKEVTEGDRDFVLHNVNALLDLDKPIEKKDIIAERCGVRPLVIKANTGASADADRMQLSRKHVIETGQQEKHITIFGGKLTDCLNVGNKICNIIEGMGIQVPFPDYKWYGEPDQATKSRFFHLARLADLDGYTSPESCENLSTRLWRRYGATAFTLLELIQENHDQAEVLIKGTEYIRCELREAARREMVTKLEDFLRRRSKIALIERPEIIKNAPGLKEACELLFGDQADEKIAEYFSDTHVV
ncbi:MAG TPA: FAD-dependent oxidoreductase [Gammaproteobacteria bacterium]|nr:FAD-dependent oxidoreductase [Gammaproteobacteria bacterium]